MPDKKVETKDSKTIESADKNISADSVKKETKEIKKEVLTSSSLDVLETQVDQTLTGADVKKGLESLGTEVDYSKINSKVENENKLTTLSDQVNIVLTNTDKSVEQIVETQGEMPLEAMNTYVGFNVIGSLYAACMKKAGKSDGTIDATMFDNMISGYDISTIAGLKDSLTKSGAILDDKEKQVVAMLEGNSVFAKDYIAKEYSKVVALMRKSIPNMLHQYNTYVVANPTSGKNWLDKTGETLKNIGNKFMEHPVRNVVLLTGGFLVGRWIYRKITGKKKKKKDGDEETKSSGFNRFLKGVLKVGGVTCVAVLLWKMLNGLGTGNPFNWNNQPGDVVDKNDQENFLKDPNFQKYQDMADKINGYYADEIHGDGEKKGIQGDDDMFGESSYENYNGVDLKGVVPYVINKRYATLNHLMSENTIVKEIISGDVNSMLAGVKQWCGDKAEALLGPILSRIGNFPTIFGGKKRDTDAVFDWIRGNTEAQDHIRNMFEKIIKIIAYFKNREEELKKKTSDDFVKNEYLGKSIIDAYQVLVDKGIEKATLDKEDKEVFDQLSQERREYHEILDPLASGEESIDKNKSEEVSEICEEITDKIESNGKRTYLQRMFSFFSAFRNSEENAELQYMDGSEYNTIIKPYLQKLSTIKEKADNGTLTPADLKELQEVVDDYTKFQQKLVRGTLDIQKVKNDNGNWVARMTYGFKIMGTDFVIGVDALKDGLLQTGKGIIQADVGDIAEGIVQSAKSGVVLYPTGVTLVGVGLMGKGLFTGDGKTFVKGAKFLWNGYTRPLRKPLQISMRKAPSLTAFAADSRLLGKEGLMKIYGVKNINVATNALKNVTDFAKIIRMEYMSGRMSINQALTMLNRVGYTGTSAGLNSYKAADLYKDFFERSISFTDEEVSLLNKYLPNQNIKNALCNKTTTGNKLIKNFRRKALITDIKLNENAFKQLLKAEQDILSMTTKPGVTSEAVSYTQKCATSFLKHTNNFDEGIKIVEKMIANPVKGLMNPELFGKVLGKNASKVGAQGLLEITQFIKKAHGANKIVSAEKFILNTIRNYTKLKAANFELSAIESLSLNKGWTTRFVETTGKRAEGAKDSLLRIKEGLKKSPQGLTQAWTKLQNTLKGVNPAKFPASIRQQATAQLEASKVAAEEGKVAVTSLQDQLNVVRSQVQGAEQTAEAVAQIEAKQISTLQKVLKNPVIKRLVKYSPALLELGFAAWGFAEMGSEIKELRKTNAERADVKDDHRYFDVAASSVGATIMIIGIANGWNPVGWGTLAVGLAIEGVKKLSESYYEVVESYYKNVEEFRREYMGTIKQELISKSASGQGVEISFKENHQQFWASIGGVFGIDTFKGQKKTGQTTIVLEDATRALIYMEEMERFPMADMDMNLIDPSTEEGKKIQEQIKKDRDGIKDAVTKRFAYILAQRPSLRDPENPSFLSKEAFTDKGHALDEINTLLLNSRKHIRIEGKDIGGYEKGELQALQGQKHDFDKYEMLRKNNRRDMQCVAYWLDSYEGMIENYKDNNPQYSAIKEKIAYFKKYYGYKTFGYIATDFPMASDQLAGLEPDMNMVENMLMNGEVVPTTLKKEDVLPSIQEGKMQLVDANQTAEMLSVSPVLGQHIFFRIAKEVMGYKGNNNLQELKAFYSMEKDDTNGIYHRGNTWYINLVGFNDPQLCDDSQLNDIKIFEGLKGYFESDAKYLNLKTETKSGDPTINREFAAKKIAIINEELAMKTTQKQTYIKKSIEDFVKERAKDGYVQLPPELVAEAIRAGMTDIGSCLYTFDGTKIVCVAPQYVQHTYKNNKHSLGYPIEFIQTSHEGLDMKINTLLSMTDNAHNELYRMVVEDKNSDFDFNNAIISLVKEKSTTWKVLKEKIIAAKGSNQQDIEKMQLMQKEFGNIFTTILSIGSRGNSNDVDSTDHFEKILALQSVDFVSLSLDMTNISYTFADPGLESSYTKELQVQCKKQTIPGTTKTIEDYFREGDSNQKKIATRAANVVMQSIMESAMLKYDATGKITEIYGWGDRGINRTRLGDYIKKRLTKENIGV